MIIPSYNYAEYLPGRIESVLNQTYRDFEVIVIDDASSDASPQIISRYLNDRRIRAVFREQNSGNLFRNWNLGVEMAGGEYIWIAESDDLADERFLEMMIISLDRYPSAGLAYCQSLMVDKNGKIAGSMLDHTADLDAERWTRSWVNSGKDECARFLVFKNTIPNASAVLFRKRTYLEAGGADESVRYGNDWLTWVSMLQISDVCYVHEPLNFYRCHSGSVREKMDLTENEIMGSYMVLGYILSRQELDTRVKKRVFRYRVANWVNIYYRGRKDVNRVTNREIFRLVRSFDRMIFFRYTGEWLAYPFRVGLAKCRSLALKFKRIITNRRSK